MDIYNARKSLYLSGSDDLRGNGSFPKPLLGPGYLPTSPLPLQEGNPELSPSLGIEAAGDRAKDPSLILHSLGADEATLSMKCTLIYC